MWRIFFSYFQFRTLVHGYNKFIVFHDWFYFLAVLTNTPFLLGAFLKTKNRPKLVQNDASRGRTAGTASPSTKRTSPTSFRSEKLRRLAKAARFKAAKRKQLLQSVKRPRLQHLRSLLHLWLVKSSPNDLQVWIFFIIDFFNVGYCMKYCKTVFHSLVLYVINYSILHF